VRLEFENPELARAVKVTGEFEYTQASEVLRSASRTMGGDYDVSDGTIRLEVLFGSYPTPASSGGGRLLEKLKSIFR